MPGIAGGEKANACASGSPASRLFRFCMIRCSSQSWIALVPRFERDEIKRVVSQYLQGSEAEADDRVVRLNAGRLLQNGFDFFRHIVGPL